MERFPLCRVSVSFFRHEDDGRGREGTPGMRAGMGFHAHPPKMYIFIYLKHHSRANKYRSHPPLAHLHAPNPGTSLCVQYSYHRYDEEGRSLLVVLCASQFGIHHAQQPANTPLPRNRHDKNEAKQEWRKQEGRGNGCASPIPPQGMVLSEYQSHIQY